MGEEASRRLEAIWREHRSELRGFILKRVHSLAETEDILHDVFLKMLSGLESVDKVEHLRAWLFTVARNAVVDYFRRKRPTDELQEDIPDSHDLDQDAWLLKDVGSSLKPMLNALPEKIRAALVMADLQGVKQREVALRLGISLPAVKSRVLRGRAMIRRMIEDCCLLELDARGSIMGYTAKSKGPSRCCQ